MIHPHTELKFIDEKIGYGVVARQFIPKGTILWVQDKLDREYTPDQMDQFDEIYRDLLMTYTFRNHQGKYVFCWDHERYINHSFNPNCMATPYQFEIALRNIQAGEQLTNDYGTLNIVEPFCPFDEGNARKVIYPDDLCRYYQQWDIQIASAFKKINQVDQLLFKMFDQQRKKKIDRILKGELPLDSILTCYYKSDR